MNPEIIISQNPGISIGEDIAEDYTHFSRLILAKYQSVLNTEFIETIMAIERHLTAIQDWSNTAFKNSDEWTQVREISKSSCLKAKILA